MRTGVSVLILAFQYFVGPFALARSHERPYICMSTGVSILFDVSSVHVVGHVFGPRACLFSNVVNRYRLFEFVSRLFMVV